VSLTSGTGKGGITFGLLLHTRYMIRDGQAADFADLWRQAAEAQSAGYDEIWLGDSVTTLDRARGDCLTLMAALAMATRTIAIGTVPLLMSLRHPVPLAHMLATIDVISNGRLRIGASPGPVAPYMSRQFEACGVPAGEKAGRLSESVELCRRLWTEDRVTYRGRYFSLDNEGILPKPVQKPAIPIWLATGGARAEPALRRVARLADGWISTGPTPADFAQCRAAIEAYARDYGRSPDLLAPSLLYAAIRIGEDGARTREEGWAWMEGFFRRPRARLEGTYTPIFGTVADCVAKLRAYLAAGMTGLIVRVASDDTTAQTELLLGTVKPALARMI
jgi:alkanesulfonate monooxygenase SsuD/methylene tetrahydromethanopterin reductase-like flavin-dependent oxidoreductase (luciferase family)